MTENKKALEMKVHDWLSSQGYPLEMTVASAFGEAGFQITQSEYYTDPETNESREIDVVASGSKTIRRKYIQIEFVVECKVSKNKPWVLFTSAQGGLPGRTTVTQRAASKLGTDLLRRISDYDDIQDSPLFRLLHSPAYGMTQAFTSGNDICYAAAMAVAKATQASIRKADEEPFGLWGKNAIFKVVFPVIVIEGRLFEAFLDESLKLKVSEINQGILLWRNRMVGKRFTVISVISTSFLDEFCQNARMATDAMLDRSDSVVSEVIAKEEEERAIDTKLHNK